MKYGDLVTQVSEKWDTTPKQAHNLLSDLWGVMSDSLEKGEKISVRNFGTFFRRDVKARKARNPRTGDTFTTSPYSKFGFKGRKIK